MFSKELENKFMLINNKVAIITGGNLRDALEAVKHIDPIKPEIKTEEKNI